MQESAEIELLLKALSYIWVKLLVKKILERQLFIKPSF